jgi:phage shock protein PspC (stress-responsive transcriptional regulator)
MKRYSRSAKYNIIGGVFGGFGEYFNVDPILLRIPFAVLFTIAPLQPYLFWTYLIMWFISNKE